MEKKAAHGKVRKVRGKDLWYINYCYSGRRDAVHFGKSEVQDGKYICYVGAYCWYADSFGIAAVMVVIFVISICCAAATFLLPEPRK